MNKEVKLFISDEVRPPHALRFSDRLVLKENTDTIFHRYKSALIIPGANAEHGTLIVAANGKIIFGGRTEFNSLNSPRVCHLLVGKRPLDAPSFPDTFWDLLYLCARQILNIIDLHFRPYMISLIPVLMCFNSAHWYNFAGIFTPKAPRISCKSGSSRSTNCAELFKQSGDYDNAIKLYKNCLITPRVDAFALEKLIQCELLRCNDVIKGILKYYEKEILSYRRQCYSLP